MRTETMAKEKAAATANSNRQSKRLPLQRSRFQYIIGNADFQAKHKNGPEMPCKAFEPENGKEYPQKFFSIFKRDSGEFKRIAAMRSPGKTKCRIATRCSLALCLVLISMIKRFNISNSVIELS